MSLDAKVQSEDGEGHLYDVIPDLSDSFEKFEDKEALKTEIAKLDPTEQKVVAFRFVQANRSRRWAKFSASARCSSPRGKKNR